MGMLTVDSSLFICTCAHICMQAFVYFQGQKEALCSPVPHPPTPSDMQLAHKCSHQGWKCGNIIMLLCDEPILPLFPNKLSLLRQITAEYQKPHWESVRKQKLVQRERMLPRILPSAACLPYRQALAVFQWYLCAKDNSHSSFLLIK